MEGGTRRATVGRKSRGSKGDSFRCDHTNLSKLSQDFSHILNHNPDLKDIGEWSIVGGIGTCEHTFPSEHEGDTKTLALKTAYPNVEFIVSKTTAGWAITVQDTPTHRKLLTTTSFLLDHLQHVSNMNWAQNTSTVSSTCSWLLLSEANFAKEKLLAQFPDLPVRTAETSQRPSPKYYLEFSVNDLAKEAILNSISNSQLDDTSSFISTSSPASYHTLIGSSVPGSCDLLPSSSCSDHSEDTKNSVSQYQQPQPKEIVAPPPPSSYSPPRHTQLPTPPPTKRPVADTTCNHKDTVTKALYHNTPTTTHSATMTLSHNHTYANSSLTHSTNSHTTSNHNHPNTYTNTHNISDNTPHNNHCSHSDGTTSESVNHKSLHHKHASVPEDAKSQNSAIPPGHRQSPRSDAQQQQLHSPTSYQQNHTAEWAERITSNRRFSAGETAANHNVNPHVSSEHKPPTIAIVPSASAMEKRSSRGRSRTITNITLEETGDSSLSPSHRSPNSNRDRKHLEETIVQLEKEIQQLKARNVRLNLDLETTKAQMFSPTAVAAGVSKLEIPFSLTNRESVGSTWTYTPPADATYIPKPPISPRSPLGGAFSFSTPTTADIGSDVDKSHCSSPDKSVLSTTSDNSKNAASRTNRNPASLRLSIVLLLIGSEGDVRPYIPFANALQQEKHTVRFATHERHRHLVTKHGLSFHPLAADPKDLMDFAVKHPDLWTLNPKEAVSNLKKLFEIFQSMWIACSTPPCDVIIANPPSFVHVDIAEKLNVPCLLLFPFPYTYTPTAHIKHPFTMSGKFLLTDEKESYRKIDQINNTEVLKIGLPPYINGFRKQCLQLPPRVDGMMNYPVPLRLSHLYTCSKHLISKPPDWGDNVTVSNFWFLDEPIPATKKRNTEDSTAFIVDFIQTARTQGKAVIYFGYGSVPVPNPTDFVKTIVTSVRKIGAAALLQSGWADLGKSVEFGNDVLLIGRANHLWLFSLVDVVCHHGGIGTLATGLRVGKPTLVTPFFGDQFLWADAVESKIYGAQLKITDWMPYKLSQKLKFCLQDLVVHRVRSLGEAISSEWDKDNVEEGLNWFYQSLPLTSEGYWIDVVYEYQKKKKKVSERPWIPHHKARPWSDETGILHLKPAKGKECPPGWCVVKDWEKGDWEYAGPDDKQKIRDVKVKSLYNFTKRLHDPKDTRRRRRWLRIITYDHKKH